MHLPVLSHSTGTYRLHPPVCTFISVNMLMPATSKQKLYLIFLKTIPNRPASKVNVLALQTHSLFQWFRGGDVRHCSISLAQARQYDTFTQIRLLFVEEFHQHLRLNNIDTNIKFTIEEESDDKLPFLDTLVHLGESGKIWVMVYRKATYTDQYLNFGSNHHLQHKWSMLWLRHSLRAQTRSPATWASKKTKRQRSGT